LKSSRGANGGGAGVTKRSSCRLRTRAVRACFLRHRSAAGEGAAPKGNRTNEVATDHIDRGLATVTAGHSYPVGANTGSGCRSAVAGRQAAGYTFPQISLRYLRRRVLLRVSGRMLKLSAPAFNKQRSIERPKAQVIAVIERLTGVRPNPEFITDRGTDACVICGADTEVPSQLHVNLREGYIDGVGQCCASCGSD